jgi:GNAT superfamily N-acetyltransferase
VIEGARLATEADLEAMAELADEGLAEQAESRGGSIWKRRETRPTPFLASLHSAMLDPEQELWVGTIDDVIVGYGSCRVELLRDGDLLGVIDDFYVDSGTRGVGVGEAIINEVTGWCTARNCVGIDALALPGNRHTKNFFETFGFKARLITVHHPLVAPDEEPRFVRPER